VSASAARPQPARELPANVVSLDDWRARRGFGAGWPDPEPPLPRPLLRLVDPDDGPGELRLDVFLSRAALVLAGE